MAVADVNLDGTLDVATALSVTGQIGLLIGDGKGSFIAAPPIPTVTSPYALGIGDFDEDGLPDLAIVAVSSTSVAVVLNASQ